MADPLLPVTGIVMAAMTPGPNVLLIVGVLLAGIFVARRWPMWVSAALVVVFALIGGMLVAAWRVP